MTSTASSRGCRKNRAWFDPTRRRAGWIDLCSQGVAPPPDWGRPWMSLRKQLTGSACSPDDQQTDPPSAVIVPWSS